MKYQLYILLTTNIIITYTQTNNTQFITHTHSDIDRPVPNQPDIEPLSITGSEPKHEPSLETRHEHGTEPRDEPSLETRHEPVTENVKNDDGIVFIPNDKPVFRNDAVYNDDIRVGEVVDTRRIGGLMRGGKISETESPKDILFVSGKNKDNAEKPKEFAKKQERQDTHVKNSKNNKINKKTLNCTHLECNNTVNSICGGKEENKHMKYRLFLNECYFRKVNCGFQHAVNRYEMVEMDLCKNVGAHYLTKPYIFKPIPLPAQKELTPETRRSFSSRRSQTLGVDGSFCAHACPAFCTEDYDPQCAVSSSGQRKMFLNHCKLDYNSCLYKVVWHRRPLSECVGGRKADMTQNRGFVGWMQRVGILDRKGKLVLS